MKCLIRFLSINAAGGTEQKDKIVDAPTITIGRATDQTLHLQDRRARLQHAEISQQKGNIHITTSALAGVTVNGRSQRDAKLAAGDVIEVGSNVLRVIEPPADVDFALTFELSDDAASDDLTPVWSAGDAGNWSKRRLSWWAVVVVLTFALILPALSLLNPGLASVMRGVSGLPDDSMWLAGPVHGKHASISSDCQNCHVDAFSRVPDSACQACHAAARHVAAPGEAILGTQRCASCHLEHNEPPSLVKRHQGLCANCHGDLSAEANFGDASDFLDDHPGFRVSLLLPEADDSGELQWRTEHSLLQDSAGADQSNLKFNHAVHLDEAGIVAPDGRRVVDCVDCHVPEPGGARMQPIRMDQHCIGCHTLNFDPDDPLREVPHGDPPAVLQVLIEYYSARLLGADPDDTEQRLRRPGRTLSRADRDKAATEARVRALQVAEDLFERQACANCHEVTKRDGDQELPWHVQPVRLTERFFPHANFSHAAHDTEVSSCDACHDAAASENSHDVLMPAIDDCRACHGSGVARRNSASQTPSTCIMCHSFHFAEKGSVAQSE